MPYIKREDRIKWQGMLEEISAQFDQIPEKQQDGELNYLVSSILLKVYEKEGEKRSYFKFNRMMGVLTSITQEAYRRRVAPYEDTKIIENSDIIPEKKEGYPKC